MTPRFLGIAFIVVGWTALQIATKGGRKGTWYAWLPVALFLPMYRATWKISTIVVDPRIICLLMVIPALLFLAKNKYRFHFCDVLIGCLFVSIQYSDFRVGDVMATTVVRDAMFWFGPYVIGRLFFNSAREIPDILPLISKLLLAMCFLCTLEAFTRINPIQKAMAKRFPKLERGEGYRWGIKRAMIATGHPISCGFIVICMFPWALEAKKAAKDGKGPKWWKILPMVALICVICTASRGPIMMTLGCAYAARVIAKKEKRIILVLIVVIGGGSAAVFKDAVLDAIGKSAGAAHDKRKMIKIKGVEYEYTGTRHRLLLEYVYADAINSCGWFGYGYRMRGVVIESHLIWTFGSIDNHYLLFKIQRGKLGLYLFCALGIWAIIHSGLTGWNDRYLHSSITGKFSGAMVGTFITLRAVFFANDHGGFWLFTVGLIACLGSLPKIKNDEDEEDKATSSAMLQSHLNQKPRKRVHGHAPKRVLENTAP